MVIEFTLMHQSLMEEVDEDSFKEFGSGTIHENNTFQWGGVGEELKEVLEVYLTGLVFHDRVRFAIGRTLYMAKVTARI